jgi:predicted nucleic acid-binding protein
MILVDTSVWVDYFNGADSRQTNILDDLLGTGEILTGEPMESYSNAHMERGKAMEDEARSLGLN